MDQLSHIDIRTMEKIDELVRVARSSGTRPFNELTVVPMEDFFSQSAPPRERERSKGDSFGSIWHRKRTIKKSFKN